ncbi:hypothetical protein LOK49_Contig3G00025, partial [Camellia lanceoleosa]
MVNVIHSKANENDIRGETQKVKHLQHVNQVGQKRPQSEECQGPMITFIEADLEMVQHPHNDALVYDLEFRPRTAIKSQVLADFVAEFTPESIEHRAPLSQDERCPNKQGEAQPKAKEQRKEKLKPCSIYISDSFRLFVDGSSNRQGAGAGVVLISPDGKILEQSIRLGFKASNNEAEYEVLITGLKLEVAAEADE